MTTYSRKDGPAAAAVDKGKCVTFATWAAAAVVAWMFLNVYMMIQMLMHILKRKKKHFMVFVRTTQENGKR